MKQVRKRKDGDKEARRALAPALRPLDADIIRFVEALAIADARRDYLAATQAASVREGTTGNLNSRTGASTNDPCSHLRPLFDGPPEREIH
jgi:hypothetical protein